MRMQAFHCFPTTHAPCTPSSTSGLVSLCLFTMDSLSLIRCPSHFLLSVSLHFDHVGARTSFSS